MRGGRPTLAITVIAGVLAASGTVAIALAVTAQEHAPQPPQSEAGSLGPPAAPAGLRGPRSSPDGIPQAVGPALPPSAPVAIDIPAIGVHSPLQHLGLTAVHTLEVPAPGPRYDDAAWYEHSATPGALGPAVILGHVDSPDQGPSVFFKLGDLRRGDRVRVTRADGLVAVFKVDGVRSYAKDRFPTQLVFADTRHAALRLITCGGEFDRATRRYRDNIVVFASLVGSHDASRMPGHL